MKYIVNLTDEVQLIKGMTLDQKARIPIVNPALLEWPETKALLSQKKIGIESDNEPDAAPSKD